MRFAPSFSQALRRAVRLVPRNRQRSLFTALAREIGVTAVRYDGELGSFEGSVRDQFVMASYLATGTWDPGLHVLLKERIFAKGSGTLIDVGANIGLTSIPIARAKNVRCFCFEPDPDNFRALSSNIAANRVGERVSAFHAAAMAAAGEFVLERSPDNMGDHRIRTERSRAESGPYDEAGWDTTRVRAVTLDGALEGEQLDQPVVMKVDTQGAEVQVLKGATRTLERTNFLVIEYWPYGLRRAGDSPQAFFSALSTFPYSAIIKMHDIVPPRLRPTEEVFRQLEGVPIDDSPLAKYVDVLLSRSPSFAAPG